MKFKRIKSTIISLIMSSLVQASPLNQDPFQLANAQQASTLKSLFINIHYAKASDLAQFLNEQKPSLLSNEGHLKADNRTNILWIQDKEECLEEIKQIITKLDIPVKQILIKARIVNLDERFLQNLGIAFGMQSSANTSDLNLSLSNTSFQAGQFNIPIVKLQNEQFVDLQLNALEQDGHAQIISSPELITNNRVAASIQSGEEVPYQEQTISGNTSVTFKKAVLKLKVTPAVMPNNQVLLQLEINQDKISTLSVQGVPAIRTQELITEVLLNSKETVVLGGIYEENDSHALNQTPVLSKIPLLGRLFQQHQKLRERKKLLIFITPVVL